MYNICSIVLCYLFDYIHSLWCGFADALILLYMFYHFIVVVFIHIVMSQKLLYVLFTVILPISCLWFTLYSISVSLWSRWLFIWYFFNRMKNFSEGTCWVLVIQPFNNFIVSQSIFVWQFRFIKGISGLCCIY